MAPVVDGEWQPAPMAVEVRDAVAHWAVARRAEYWRALQAQGRGRRWRWGGRKPQTIIRTANRWLEVALDPYRLPCDRRMAVVELVHLSMEAHYGLRPP
jgi:hypothetical protein